jgi:hypothetical protein
MWNFLERLLDSSTFSPHGICLSWEPELIRLHVVSDALIAMAYFSIPFAMAIFVSKRRDLLFGWVPAIGQLLSWWNPTLWMVSREWGLAQEIACDEFAVQTTAALPVHFGQMLLAMTMAGRRPQAVSVAAVGLTGEHQTLKRRLIGMRHIGMRTRPGVNMTMRTVLFSVAVFLIPWHPVPRDEYRAPRAAMTAWHGFQTAGRIVDHDVTQLALLCSSVAHPHSGGAPTQAAVMPQIGLPASVDTHADLAAWDVNGGTAKTAFTPSAPHSDSASVY